MKLTTDYIIKKAKKVHGNKYEYENSVYTNSKNKMIINCPLHGEFKQLPSAHISNKQGCPRCAKEKLANKKRLTTDYIIKKAKETHGGKYNYDSTLYVNSRIKIKYECKIHGIVSQLPLNHINGMGCVKCGNANKMINGAEWCKQAKNIHNNRYDYSKINFTKLDNDVEILCPVHGKFIQQAKIHLKGSGCPKCGIESKRDNKESFIKKAKEVHGNSYDYSNVKYINSKIPVDIKCDKHGIFSQQPTSHLSGRGCLLCNESKGENKIAKYLDKLNIKYKREYKLDKYDYRYDFYLPELNILIEYDGIQHFKPVKHFGGIENLKKTKERDNNKNLLAKSLGYKLIRIPYTKFKVIDNYLLNKIRYFYKYRIGNIFYKNIIELYKAGEIPDTYTAKQCSQYKL
jgi:very-short-patch-repair endonuclease